MSTPLISVVLPTFNRAATLPRAIASVLGQSLRDFELVVVDDGSTDNTAELVRRFADPRLLYLALPRNRGAGAARNAGIAATRGEWIAFQDSDDEWLPDKLYRQWEVARSAAPQLGLVLGGYLAMTPQGPIPIEPVSALAGGSADPDVLAGWPIITPTWLARRNLIESLHGFDETYACLEDWDLALRMTGRCEIGAVPGPTLLKHDATDSICADDKRLCTALERILATHGSHWDHFGAMKARRLAHLGCLYFRLGQPAAARAALRQARAADPNALATRALLLASHGGHRVMTRMQRTFPRHATMAP